MFHQSSINLVFYSYLCATVLKREYYGEEILFADKRH